MTNTNISLTNSLVKETSVCIRTDISGYSHVTFAQFTQASRVIYETILKSFEKFGLEYYLFAGSLVGYVRNKRMPAWMDDLDVIIFEKDVHLFENTIVPFLVSCGFDCFAPADYPGSGYHLLALRQGERRSLTIPLTNDIQTTVPWAQVDVFYSKTDENGFVRNLGTWGMYHKKDIPLSWVQPGTKIEMEGWKVSVFSQYERDILHEYGDVRNHIVVATHDRVFLSAPQTSWADFEAEFDRCIVQTANELPPSLSSANLSEWKPSGNVELSMQVGESFDEICGRILASNASRLRLLHGDQIFWVMDLKRIFPALHITALISGRQNAARAAHLRRYVDEVFSNDASIIDMHRSFIARLDEID